MTQLLSDSSMFEEDKFRKYFMKMVTRMRELEKVKYLPPKFSYAYENL